MENLRNRCTVDLVKSEEMLKKLTTQLSFKQFKILHENLVAVERTKVELTLNWPIYMGFASWIFRKDWCMISTTVASSESIQTWQRYLLIQIPSSIKFKRIMCMKTSMPISSCSIFPGTGKKIPFYNDANKKINGKMKDELNWEFIEEFVGLRAKMYSLKTRNEETKKAKGVKKNVVKKDISLQDYVDCLFEERKFMHTMQTIRSFKHQLYTIKQNKVSLSPCDDKQYLLDDGVSSLPYGCFSWLLIFRKCVDYFFRNFCNIFYFWRNLNRIKKSF